MRARDFDESLLVAHRAHIRAPSVRLAYDLLTSHAQEVEEYQCKPRNKGLIRDFCYYKDGLLPFSFITNTEDLLFYVRRSAFRQLPEGPSGLRANFGEVHENPAGELNIRVREEATARELIDYLFRTGEGAVHIRGIPDGITAADVREALADIKANRIQDNFGGSRLWDLFIEGQRYHPKRVIGVAARRVAGRVLEPADFTGGEESKCHRILESLGFRIVPKRDRHVEIEAADDAVESEIRQRVSAPETERIQLIRARRGQGLFRQALARIEKECRVTGVRELEHLRASHIKPWCRSSDAEKLDGANGLLLAPHVDHLFDQGFISFSDAGALLVARCLNPVILTAWGIYPTRAHRPFSVRQRQYLQFHRESVFLGNS